jgi:hypothetical protein
VAYGAGFLAWAALGWAVRDAPLQPGALGGWLRIDALGTFFALLALAGGALLTWRGAAPLPVALATLALLVSYGATHLLAPAGALLIATLLLARPANLLQTDVPAHFQTATPAAQGEAPPSASFFARHAQPIRHGLWDQAGARALIALPGPACLLAACATLWLRGGGLRYDAPAAGAAFGSLVFWFVLLATLMGGGALLRVQSPLAPAWLYPLLRLYSLGPWNTGWSFATLLLGGSVALWCAAEATRAAEAAPRRRWIVGTYGGVALACAGLSSAAGVAASCYALLCALLLNFGLPESRPQTADRRPQTADQGVGEQGEADAQREETRASPIWPALLLATLAGALPITVPFVSLWLGVGAAVAGGVPLLSVALWLAGLGAALAVLRTAAEERAAAVPPTSLRRRAAAAALSVALGVAAPAVVAWPIMSVARQLGGGLTPYGDLAIWPWVGLAALDAARQPVASLPSAALAGLMLVLGALAWLFTLYQAKGQSARGKG